MAAGQHEFFCENPKCPHHRLCHPSQMIYQYGGVQKMWWVVPSKVSGKENINADAMAPMTMKTTEVARVNVVGAHGIQGWFCEVCAEAIRAVEGF
ncbi:hypothetical protein DLP05_049 [Stenotrophomonas phage vB_SmaS_DLP_5]|uniref:Uncharacterized protein n=1 Tax=Stenotrophomonas phage vB_SmaS_DLP_5 TaxID=2044561 RepID=A0A2D2W2M4_9CAUD|nr:hypothetical protein FDJ07_gp048 [Stenotrophomonas phage vB_SmaS_DLP_5]ATS92378.1 hypothetical protein DLP05_049 [Stenotrophomonas phage vB_SmaS_DLP_5]